MENSKLIINFYNNYRKLHLKVFNEFNIKENNEIKQKYVTFFFNRLMILFFLEKEGYLNNNINFLEENFYDYNKNNINYYDFFRKICFNYLGKINNNKYKIPYINCSFFKENDLDIKYANEIISNKTFESIFLIFNKYTWKLKENEGHSNISPKILGNIFEKYINQKQMGAYYTSSDTTEYISKNVILNKILYEINKKFQFNLDIKEFVKENKNIKEILFKLMNDIKVLEYVFQIIIGNKKNNLSIIDPTCGSGAFIFSALELLEEILEIAYKNIRNKNLKDYNYLEKIVVEIEKHKNFRYFITKEIMSKNLFGVDIAEEAVEILKLRLYLKLLSLVENVNEIELFPDLNNNFFCGNSLVGNVFCKNDKLEKNKDSFNWNKSYKHIFENGGFDCIIGNPPYIEYSKITEEYIINDISTLKCGNLYAFITERSMQILKIDGICGMIVPISIVSTPRMNLLRKYLYNNSRYIFFSNFADRPGCLFQGVHQKLTIFINQKKSKENAEIFTTDYTHWYSKDERNNIFNNIKYYRNNFIDNIDNCIFKIGNNMQENIIKKIFIKKKSLVSNFDKEGDYTIYLNMRLTYWSKCFYKEKKSNEYKKIYFADETKSKVFMTLFNSSLFFMFWEMVSDNWHITNKELNLFKFDYFELDDSSKINLKKLSEILEKDLEKNKRYIGSKQADYEYVHKYSKKIIDKVDEELGKYYNFSIDELSYIQNYNLKYRIGERE